MVLILIVLASEYFVCCLTYWGSSDDLLLHPISSFVIWHTKDLHLSHDTLYLWFSSFLIHSIKPDLFIIYRDDSLAGGLETLIFACF